MSNEKKDNNTIVIDNKEWEKFVADHIFKCEEKIPVGMVAYLFMEITEFIEKHPSAKELRDIVGSRNLKVVDSTLATSFFQTIYANTKEGKEHLDKMFNKGGDA